jgi:subtilisin family serine protease
MSFSGQYSRFSIFSERAIDYASRQGCILVASAGNDNTSDLVYPASYEQVIAVSAIDQNDSLAEFSNFDDYIDFCAPGINIVSAGKDGGYLMANGTSFSAPFVAGLVALMLSEDSGLTTAEVKTNLRIYAEDLGEEGFDQFYGWGLANTNFLKFDDVVPEFPSWTTLLVFGCMIVVAIYRKKIKDKTVF